MDLALHNLQRLICHKNQANKQALWNVHTKFPTEKNGFKIYKLILLFIEIWFNKNFVNYYVSKVGDCGQGWPEGSLFNSYYTEV